MGSGPDVALEGTIWAQGRTLFKLRDARVLWACCSRAAMYNFVLSLRNGIGVPLLVLHKVADEYRVQEPFPRTSGGTSAA
jgi:hypothetical protein